MGALQHLDSIIYDFAVWNLIQINAISFILKIELGISLLLDYNFPLFRPRPEHCMEGAPLWPAQGCLDREEGLLRREQPREAGLEDREGRGGRDSQGLGDLGDPGQPPSRGPIQRDPH